MGLENYVFFYHGEGREDNTIEYTGTVEIDASVYVSEERLNQDHFKAFVHKQLIETLEDRLEKMITMKRVDKLKELRDVQCSDGNWNLTEYMRGLANGLILAVSVFDEQEPKFKEEQGDISPYKASLMYSKIMGRPDENPEVNKDTLIGSCDTCKYMICSDIGVACSLITFPDGMPDDFYCGFHSKGECIK